MLHSEQDEQAWGDAAGGRGDTAAGGRGDTAAGVAAEVVREEEPGAAAAMEVWRALDW